MPDMSGMPTGHVRYARRTYATVPLRPVCALTFFSPKQVHGLNCSAPLFLPAPSPRHSSPQPRPLPALCHVCRHSSASLPTRHCSLPPLLTTQPQAPSHQPPPQWQPRDPIHEGEGREVDCAVISARLKGLLDWIWNRFHLLHL